MVALPSIDFDRPSTITGPVTDPTGRARKIALLGSLYFAQGLPFGFFTQALPVLLRKQGHSLGAIGLSSMLALPWALKFLWAPLVDRRGSRRAWILAMQLASTLLLGALALAFATTTSGAPGSLTPLLVAVFLTNLASATQDIATDGLAVDILAPHERGLANGIQVGGYRLGMIAGGGALLVLFDRTGAGTTFAAMCLLLVVSSLPLVFTKSIARDPRARVPRSESSREAPVGGARPDNKARPPEDASGSRPVHFLRRAGAGRILVLLLAYKLGDAFATGMLRPFLTDLGLSLGDIGEIVGSIGFAAGLVGALAGGALVNRLGRKRALLAFGTLQALSVAGYAFLAHSPGEVSLPAIWIVAAAEHFAGGMATAALFTAMMDWCDPKSGATDYTVQASTVVVATGIAGAISGFSAEALGYFGHFVCATIFALVAIATTALLFPTEENGRELR